MNDGDAVRRYLHRGNTVTVVFVRLRTRSRVPSVRSFVRSLGPLVRSCLFVSPAATHSAIRPTSAPLGPQSVRPMAKLYSIAGGNEAGLGQDHRRRRRGGEEVRRCTGRREAVLAEGKRTLLRSFGPGKSLR